MSCRSAPKKIPRQVAGTSGRGYVRFLCRFLIPRFYEKHNRAEPVRARYDLAFPVGAAAFGVLADHKDVLEDVRPGPHAKAVRNLSAVRDPDLALFATVAGGDRLGRIFGNDVVHDETL